MTADHITNRNIFDNRNWLVPDDAEPVETTPEPPQSEELTLLSLNPIISEWFTLHPNGITVKNGTPPQEAFEVLGYYLNMQSSTYRLQVGDYCVHFRAIYPEVYQQKAQEYFVETQTIEVWANVCRSVPFEIRLPGLLYSHFRVVAAIHDKARQLRHLKHCLDNNLGVRAFEEWVAEQRGLPPPATYEDRKHERMLNEQKELDELTNINSQLSIKLSEAETQIDRLKSELQQAVIMPGDLLDPSDLPEIDALAEPVQSWLKRMNISAVIIKPEEVIIKR